ncbi:oxygenase MpaB family protein [Kitasatospora purpeofusca]|uniref:oxygenase MpaB family protein n=1 Tax=Kitasatospora purpeofusca TaxID=67352 RepID=UPI0036822EE2
MDPFVTRRTALTAALATGAAVGLPAATATARVAARPAATGPASDPGPGPVWELPADQAAQEGDPEADEVIKELVAAGQMQLANQVFHDWTRNDQPVPDSAPSVLYDFLRRHAVLSEEERAAIDLVRNGDSGKLVQGNFEAITMTEAFGGLFTALADPLLAKSVWYAKFDLVMDIGRRFSRTMNTLWDGLDGGNWDPSGNAVISVVKLRLVHAAARQTGLAHGWNQARDGMPISQRLEVEELMYVGANNVQLAAKFGFHPDPRQIDELVELIRIGGRLVGIQEKYNPRTLDQCNQVLADAAANHRAPSDEGIKLAHNMLDWMDREIFPGAGAVGASMVRMMDAHVADILDIKPNPVLDIPVATLAPYLYRPVYEIQQKFPLLVPVHEKMFKIASKTVAWYAVDFRDYDLQMPVR